MSYRNKTYVIFDADNDNWAYRFMKGWDQNDSVEFGFLDAHDLKPLTGRASEETIKRSLRERMNNAKQVIVLVGDHTKNLYRFVRWEIVLAIEMDLPIIVANLSNKRSHDDVRCPPILRDHCAIHVAFKMKAIKLALEGFAPWYREAPLVDRAGPRYYTDETYRSLGL